MVARAIPIVRTSRPRRCFWAANTVSIAQRLASGTPRRVGAVLDALLARTSVSIRVEPDPAHLRPNDTPIAVGDAERARTLLGWAAHRPWDQTLDDVLDYWRAAVIRA